ncbi:hypothetical protein, partial [Longimicrobium sp.]|uniref:hypothetical protein n=1 Tax=Longimicrobium sp. TaxID=2029185 RepID=UPI002F95C68E
MIGMYTLVPAAVLVLFTAPILADLVLKSTYAVARELWLNKLTGNLSAITASAAVLCAVVLVVSFRNPVRRPAAVLRWPARMAYLVAGGTVVLYLVREAV